MRRLLPALALLLLCACQEPPPAAPVLREEDDALQARLERLASAGELAAAEGVLAQVLGRPDPAHRRHDQARLAMVRGHLRRGDRVAAQRLLRDLPWADKVPAVAAEVVALGVQAEWQGLIDGEGRLFSGVLPPRLVEDSDQGRPGGAWAERGERLRAIETLLGGGGAMVRREGVALPLAMPPALLDLARFAHGGQALPDLAAADARTRLAAVRLLLAEHDPAAAAALAEPLWRSAAPEGAAAFQDLRTWQLRRRAAHGLPLWTYPALDARLDALAPGLAPAASAAAAAVAADAELGRRGLQSLLKQELVTTRTDVEGLIDGPAQVREPEWTLATTWDGLQLRLPETEAVLGRPVAVDLVSEHRGLHRITVLTVADDAVWRRLAERPDPVDLPPAATVAETVLADWAGLGSTRSERVLLSDLPEGRFVAVAEARGCPVAVLRSFRVAVADLEAVVARDAVLLWTVDRRDGRGLSGQTVVLTAELERDAEASAGAAWAAAGPAWRAGYRLGYLGVRDEAVRAPGQEADEAAGLAAGLAAAARDPAVAATAAVVTGADGVAVWSLPPALVGRPWRGRAVLARPGGDEIRILTGAAGGAWTTTAVAWADKPLVRPGEALRFAVLLRERDGHAFRLRSASVAAEIRIGGEPVWTATLTLSPQGMADGAMVVPPGALEGAVDLLVDGVPHRLAACRRLALPPLHWSFAPLPAQVAAGETVPVTVRLRDRGGMPLAGVEVIGRITPVGVDVPLAQPAPVRSDLAGEAVIRVATLPGRELAYEVTCEISHQGWWTARTAVVAGVFPFALAAGLDRDRAEPGAAVRLHTRMPAGARIQAELVDDAGQVLGRGWSMDGGADERETLLVVESAQVGATALRLSCPVLGGGRAERRLPLTVAVRPVGGGDLRCEPLTTRLRPGDTLGVAVGCALPGRDALLLVGAQDLIAVQAGPLPTAGSTRALAVTGAWGPMSHLQAIAWLPGAGFVRTPAQELRIEPIDRLLRVAIAVDAAEPRPGTTVAATVTVRDWQGRPVPDARIVLGAVDRRIYQLAEDQTPDLWRFFHDYHRPFGLTAAPAETLPAVSAVLWRSIVRAWTVEEVIPGGGRTAAVRYGGGRKRAVGMMAQQPSPLVAEGDPTVAWIADARSGADGTCRVLLPLPAQAGDYRLTARVADGSAAVLVGEVVTTLASRRGVGIELRLPPLLTAADRIEAGIEVVQHGASAAAIRVGLPDGGERTVVAEPGRRLVVPVTVDAPPADGPVVRVEDRLGRLARIPVSAAIDGDRADDLIPVAVAGPGVPFRNRRLLVAGDDGVVLLPEPVPAGALVELAVRAWPDAAARRAQALTEGRLSGRGGVLPAQAWLLAEDDAQRRQRLAELWPTLDQSPAAQVVRLAAVRLGQSAGGLEQLPPGALGDWLAARARGAGLPVAAPRLRGVAMATVRDRVLAAGTALAEGWQEGRILWRAVRDEALADRDEVTVALALDAAGMAGDGAAEQRLRGRATGLPWQDDLARALFIDLIPAAGGATASPVRIRGGPALDAAAGARWAGVATEGFALTAAPGALLDLDLTVQAARAPWPHADGAPTIALWQLGADGYLPSAGALVPGRPTLLVIRPATAGPRPELVTLVLPSLLAPESAASESVRLIEARPRRWPLPEAVAAVRHLRGDAGAAPEEIAAFLAALDGWPSIIEPVGPTATTTIPGGGAGACWRFELRHEPILVPVRVTGTGRAVWPGALLQHGDGRWWSLPDRMVESRPPATDPPAEAAPTVHPLAPVLRERIPHLEPEVVAALLDAWPEDEDGVADLLRRRDSRRIDHDVWDLLDHPLAGRRGHWTTDRLRAWSTGDEPLRRAVAAPRGLFEYQPQVEHLTDLVDLVAQARADRQAAWMRLPAPLPALAPSGTLAAWRAALLARGAILPSPAWPWDQELPDDALVRLGYRPDLEGWVAFLRRELGVAVTIGAGIPVRRAVALDVQTAVPGIDWTAAEPAAADAPSGADLGTRDLADRGFLLVQRPGGGCELRPVGITGPLAVDVGIDLTDAEPATALTVISEALIRRGLPPLRLADDITAADLPPLTLHAERLGPAALASVVARLWGLTGAQHADAWVLRRPR